MGIIKSTTDFLTSAAAPLLILLALSGAGALTARGQQLNLVVQTGHSGEVTALAFSPDGKILASAGWDRRVKLWDLATGLEIKDLGQKETPYFQPSNFSRSGGGETRQVGGKEMYVEDHLVNHLFLAESPIAKFLFDRLSQRTQRLIRQKHHQPSPELLRGLADDLNRILERETIYSEERFKGVELSAETKALLEKNATGGGLVRLNRLLLEDAFPRHLKREYGGVTSLIFSHTGKLLAGTTFGGEIKLWNVETGAETAILLSSVGEIAFSPDDRSLAVIAWQSITLYDTASGAVRGTLGGRVYQRPDPKALSFSRDGKLLLSVEQYVQSSPRDEKENEEDGFFLRYWDVAKDTEVPKRSRRVKADTTREGTYAQIGCASPDGGALVYEVANEVKDDFGTAKVNYRVHLLNLNTGRDATIADGFRSLDALGGLGSNNKKTICEFSRDGRQLVLAKDSALTLYAAPTGEVVKNYALDFRINSLSFSNDGSRLALAGGNEVDIFDLGEGKATVKLANHASDIFAYFKHDGALVLERGDEVSQSFDPESGKQGGDANDARLRLKNLFTSKRWNVPTGECVASEVNEVKTPVEFIPRSARKQGINAEGTLVAVVLPRENEVYIVDIRKHKVIHTLRGHLEPVYETVFSPDGKILATGSFDRTVKLWDVSTGEEMRSLTGFFGMENADTLVFSGDAKLMATTSKEGGVRVWDIATGALRTAVKHDGVVAFEFGRAGDRLATAGAEGSVKVWDTSSGAELRTLNGHTGSLNSVAFDEKGDLLATGGDDHTVRLWDVATGREVKTLRGHEHPVVYVEFLPGGRLLSESVESVVELKEAGTRPSRRIFRAPSGDVARAALSLDGRTLMIEDASRGFVFWDVATAEKVFEIPWTKEEERRELGGPDQFDDYTLTAYGQDRFAVAYLSKRRSNPRDFFRLVNKKKRDAYTLKLWNLTGDGVRSASSTEVEVTDPTRLFFSPDGKWLVLTGYSIHLWNTDDPSMVLKFESDSYGNPVAISHDNQTVAVGDSSGVIQLWDVVTRKRAATLRGHTDGIVGLSFHPQKNILMSRSADGTSKFWDVHAERELATLMALDDNDWVVIAPDGRFDASPNAMKLMHYVYGLEVITLEQLKDAYYEPGLLAKLVGSGREPLRDIRPLRDVKLFPEVVSQQIEPDGATLNVRLKNRGGGIGPVRVVVNGKTVTEDARDARLKADPAVASASLRIDLRASAFVAGGENRVTTVTSNYDPQTRQSYINSRGATIVFTPKGEKNLEPPRLFAIVAGISDYAGDALDLRFAAKDAEDFATALRAGAERFFGAGNVEIKVLSTTLKEGTVWPSKKNIMSVFAQVARAAKPEDVLLIYLAGHGVSAGQNTDSYYYLTQEAHSTSKESLSNPVVRGASAISSAELTDWLTKTEWVSGEKGIKPLKQVMILDTCAAGTLVGHVSLMTKRELSGDQVRAIERLKDRTGFHILMGSAADAVSYEATQYGQGLLTYTLLQAMRGAKLREGEFADVSELFQYAADEVPILARGIGGIQKPIVAAPLGTSFDIGRFTRDEQIRVPLGRVKPIILRPRLINPEQGFDDLELEASLRKSLLKSHHAAAGRPGAPATAYVFVDADQMPGALQPSGTYVIRGDVVTVTLNLIRDGKKVASFQSTGDKTDVNALADKLTSGVSEALNRLP